MREPALLSGDPRALVGPSDPYGVVVVAGAMTDALVRAAAGAGAGLYVTGAWRAPASVAVAETGFDVLALGHARWERWEASTTLRHACAPAGPQSPSTSRMAERVWLHGVRPS